MEYVIPIPTRSKHQLVDGADEDDDREALISIDLRDPDWHELSWGPALWLCRRKPRQIRKDWPKSEPQESATEVTIGNGYEPKDAFLAVYATTNLFLI